MPITDTIAQYSYNPLWYGYTNLVINVCSHRHHPLHHAGLEVPYIVSRPVSTFSSGLVLAPSEGGSGQVVRSELLANGMKWYMQETHWTNFALSSI